MVTTLSSKGQIVVPVGLRKRYGLEPGVKVELMDIGGEIVIVPLMAIKDPIEAARGLLKGGRTTRQILKELRREEKRIADQKK